MLLKLTYVNRICFPNRILTGCICDTLGTPMRDVYRHCTKTNFTTSKKLILFLFIALAP